MAGFSFTSNDGNGRFKAPRQSSIFNDGVECTIVKAITGTWTRDNGELINKDGSNSIRFETSLSSSDEDLINITRFLSKKVVVYNDSGRASILYFCEFHEELQKFLKEKIGLDETDKRFFKGTAKEIGDKIVSDFFGGKTIVFKKVENIFFKTVKDGVEKLEAPYDDLLQIGFKA